MLGTDTISGGRHGDWAAQKAGTFFAKEITVDHHPTNASNILNKLCGLKDAGLHGRIVILGNPEALGGMNAFVPATDENGQNGDGVFDMIQTKAAKAAGKTKAMYDIVGEDKELTDPIIATYGVFNYIRGDWKHAADGADMMPLDINELNVGTKNYSWHIIAQSCRAVNGGSFEPMDMKHVPQLKIATPQTVYMSFSHDGKYSQSLSYDWEKFAVFTKISFEDIRYYVPVAMGLGMAANMHSLTSDHNYNIIIRNEGQNICFVFLSSIGIFPGENYETATRRTMTERVQHFQTISLTSETPHVTSVTEAAAGVMQRLR
jgi:hypothetical protein